MQTELKSPITFWQYKNSPKLKAIYDGIIEQIKKYYPNEIWEDLDLDTAKGYALDLIGQRLGYPRPRELDETVGQFDVSYYAQSYYDADITQLDLVKDDTYRYMLKLRTMMFQKWRPTSINSFYKALAFAFPNKNFYLRRRVGQPIIDCFILSYLTYPERRALYSDVVKAPIGQSIVFTDRSEQDTSILVDSTSNNNILTDGKGNILIANDIF